MSSPDSPSISPARASVPSAVKRSQSGEADLREGDRIGDYIVERPLGAGGQGSVYLAHDAVLRRPVALKIISGAGEENLSAVDEARMIATLDHPNIVRVHHVQRHGDTWLMAMEYVDGADLKERVQQVGPLSRTRALRFAAAAAEALEHAHQLGVIHRDVKPQNLLVSRTGALKLADFGLAAFMGTNVGSAGLGTPQFMAPEVWAGEPATAQTDVYCLGGTLLYLLTGTAPFPGKTTDKLKEAHLKLVPKLSSSLPEDIAHLLQRCLAKKPSARPASARALRAELLQLMGDSTLEPAIPLPDGEGESFANLSQQARVAADEAVLAAPPYGSARNRLAKALETIPPVVLVHGPQGEAIERVVRAVVDATGDRFYLGARTMLTGPGSLVDTLASNLKLGKLSPATAFTKIVTELQPRQGAGANPGLMQIKIQRKLTDADASDVIELARAAHGKSLVFLILGDEASGQKLFDAFEAAHQTPLLREVEIQELTPVETAAYARLWSATATNDSIRWTHDALRLLAQLDSARAAPLDRLIQNAIALSRWLKMPFLTSWCVMGAAVHPRYIHSLEDILPKWRERPSLWPDAPTLSLLSSLRSNITDDVLSRS